MKSWTFAVLGLLACTETPKAQPKRVALPVAQVQVPRVSLGQQLANELAARPAEAVRPEQLAGSLRQRGVEFARQRQVLASPIDAAYCETGVTTLGLGISLCEFADGDAAERGLAKSQVTFDSMVPGRTLITHKNALLTLTQPASAEAARQLELARATFAALDPVPLTR
jgi:hypothetical protein